MIKTAEEVAHKIEAFASYEELINPIIFASLVAKEFAKLHVEACKKEIADDYLYYLDGDEGSERLDCKKFNKEAYPLENIK